MAQSEIQVTTTPPLPGTQLVAEVNDALETIATDFSGATDPAADAFAYSLWADTNTGDLKRRNAANSAWVTIGRIYPAVTELSTGNVGIGDTNPAYKLTVAGTGSDHQLWVRNTGTSASDDAILLVQTSGTGTTSTIAGLFFGDGDNSSVGQLRYNHNNDSMTFYTAGTLKTTISADGFVGINKTPAVPLDVSGSIFSDGVIRNTNGGNAGSPSIQPGNDADTGMFWAGDNIIGFSTTGTERARISNTGRFSIGTTGTSGRLTVQASNSHGVYGETQAGTSGGLYGVYGIANISSAYASGGVVGYSINANTYGILGYWSGSAYWSFYGNNNTYITGTYQGSDERLKENILTLSGSLSKIGALRPVEFDWKENSDQAKSGHHRDVGLIAQEVLPIFPNLVKEIDARQPDEGVEKSLNEELGKFYTIEYTRLIPHLISAIQELKAEFDAYKAAHP